MADLQSKKITLYDILMMCPNEELVDIVFNGYKVVHCKPAGDLCDLLEILDDEILDSLVFRIRDDLGRIRIESTSPALKERIEDYE